MESYEPKKLLILRILEILTEYSDCDHKLRQGDIISLLKVLYGIECERKAVARNIEFLQQAGYDIVSDNSGSYLAEKKFETGELRLLIDSVLSNRNICKTHTKDLIGKLTREGGKYFKSYAKHVVNLDDWQKDENHNYFYNIELLCEAIEKKVKVKFFYQSYGADKKLHARRAVKSLVNPYGLFLKNGRYYLVCNFDKYGNHSYCRVDKIAQIVLTEQPVKPLNAVQGFENGLNLGRLNARLPYLFEDEPQRIEFITANSGENMIDNVLDWFGRDVRITELADGNFKFSLTASPQAMRFWILQFGKYVKVLSPQSLVEKIRDDIDEMKKLYGE
ncbi:MAG: WYL domain-containing protein [Lachnospiraceae bacterium]|nr:WYL domain-containing protein [Lachnospiraceae bacterium]